MVTDCAEHGRRLCPVCNAKRMRERTRANAEKIWLTATTPGCEASPVVREAAGPAPANVERSDRTDYAGWLWVIDEGDVEVIRHLCQAYAHHHGGLSGLTRRLARRVGIDPDDPWRYS